MSKKIILNENQLKAVLNEIAQSSAPYTINPHKVLIVKKFLDDTFERGLTSEYGNNGLPSQTEIVVFKNGIGKNPEENSMYKDDVIEMLIDQFKNMFLDTTERQLFMKQIMEDWYYNKISPQGLLSKNCLR